MANAGVLVDGYGGSAGGPSQRDGTETHESRNESAADVVVSRLRREAHMANAGALSSDAPLGIISGIAQLTGVEETHPEPVFHVVERINPLTRSIEIAVALLALTLTLPIQFAVGLIIRRGTPGPVLFRQQRLGLNAEKFTFVKFRTLYADARARFPELYEYKYSKKEMDTLRFKVERDPRVTPQGEWLRKTSLDELPNFWNVLTGEMALVGPRPEIPEMLPYYAGESLKKFSVRPGITGLAQTSGRGHLSFKDTVALDLEYVENRSFWLDMKILFNTLVMVVLHKGAY
jgi:lipopolysaccharide/colanic/teichoic acid biosynthesis glycosyltransferase